MAGASFTASAELLLRSNVGQQLSAMSRALSAFDSRLKATEASINSLLGRLARFGSATAGIRSAVGELSAFERAAGSATTGLREAANATAAQTRALARFATAAEQAARAQRSLAGAPNVNVPPLPPLGGAAGRRARGPAGPSRMAEAAAGAAVAYPALGFVGRAVREGADFGNQRALIQASGASPAEVGRATSQAWSTTRQVGGVTASHALRTIGELRSVFGSLDEASKASPMFERFGRMFELATGQSSEGQLLTAAKILERRGAIYKPGTHDLDYERIQSELTELARTALVTQGRVGPNQIQGFLQTGAIPASMMSDKGFWNTVTPLAQVMGGPRAGTAVNAVTRQYTGSIIDQRRLDENVRMGLIDPNRVTHMSRGRFRLQPGAITGEKEMLTDIVAWTRDTLIPQLQRHGVNTNDRQAVNREVVNLGMSQTLQRAFSELIMDMPRILKERELREAIPADAPQRLLENSPQQGIDTLRSSFTNLLQTLGDANMPTIAAAMKNIADGVNSLAQQIRDNPRIGEWIIGTAAALGTLGAVGTTLAVGSVALSGITAVAGGLTSLVGAASPFAAGGVASAGLLGTASGLIGLAAAVVALPPLLANVAKALGIQGTPGATRAGTGAASHDIIKQPDGPQQSWGDWLSNKWHDLTHGPATPQNLLPRRGDQHGDAGSNPWQYAGAVPQGGANAPIALQGNVYLDSRIVGHVSDGIAKQMSGPQLGTGRFDMRQSYSPVAVG